MASGLAQTEKGAKTWRSAYSIASSNLALRAVFESMAKKYIDSAQIKVAHSTAIGRRQLVPYAPN